MIAIVTSNGCVADDMGVTMTFVGVAVTIKGCVMLCKQSEILLFPLFRGVKILYDQNDSKIYGMFLIRI